MVHPVKPRADRILKEIESYRSVDSDQEFSYDIDQHPMGRVFGVYENSPDCCIYVAEDGLILQELQQRKYIPYREIQNAKVPGTDKLSANQIVLRMKDGREHVLPIQHGRGKTRDVWEFWRFVDRVYKDIQKREAMLGSQSTHHGADREVCQTPLGNRWKVLLIGRKDHIEEFVPTFERLLTDTIIDTAYGVQQAVAHLRDQHYDLVLIESSKHSNRKPRLPERLVYLLKDTLTIIIGPAPFVIYNDRSIKAYPNHPTSPEELAHLVRQILTRQFQ